MNSDIKLTDSEVHLEGYRTVARSADFCLDFLERRPGTDPNEYRLALVHDFNDGLTINWGGTYPGGVKIEGPVTISLDLISNSINADNITVKDIKTDIKEFKMDGTGKREEWDLGTFLGILRAMIDSLETRLSNLENK